MNKVKGILVKSREGAREVVQDGDSWKMFLGSASYTNKYSFQNQLLIYGQKEYATAVASFDIWSKYFNRWIKKGSKGVPVLDENQNIQYVFDISDTTSDYSHQIEPVMPSF